MDENGKRVKIVARENTGGEDVREKKKKKRQLRGVAEKDNRVGGKERMRDDLDEEEELAEAGQQGEEASQEAVIHIPKLCSKTQVGTIKKKIEEKSGRRW